jgi:hypothetical protein
VTRQKQLKLIVSFFGKLTIGLVVLSVFASCSSSSKTPTIDEDGSIYPSITSVDSSLTQQCRSEVIRREETSAVYLNTYFLINADGTEIVQSQSEGSEPCP